MGIINWKKLLGDWFRLFCLWKCYQSRCLKDKKMFMGRVGFGQIVSLEFRGGSQIEYVVGVCCVRELERGEDEVVKIVRVRLCGIWESLVVDDVVLIFRVMGIYWGCITCSSGYQEGEQMCIGELRFFLFLIRGQ